MARSHTKSVAIMPDCYVLSKLSGILFYAALLLNEEPPAGHES